MDAPGSGDSRSLRNLVGQTLFAGVGAVVLSAERLEELAEAIAERGQLTREEAREIVDDVTGRWRDDALSLAERASLSLGGVLREVGVVTRREWEDLELRLAQLEHRLRLLEGAPPRISRPGA